MKKGFTLIELLAVIVILAIIAVIAVPIVLNIINDTKESAVLRSADFYLDGVEKSIATSVLKNIQISDGTYSIMKDGNVCIGTLNNNTCTGEILKIEIDGEAPKAGTIEIKDGQIANYIIKYGEIVVKSEEEVVGSATFSYYYDENDNLVNGPFTLTWEELKDPANGNKFDYNASVISDTTMGYMAIAVSPSLISITLPSTMITLERDSLTDNPSLTSVDFSNCTNLTSIGEAALHWSESLTELDLSKCIKLTTLERMSFYKASSLTSVSLPNSITTIGEGTFGESSINSITFAGTKAQWNAIEFGYGWIDGEVTITCTDGTITISADF